MVIHLLSDLYDKYNREKYFTGDEIPDPDAPCEVPPAKPKPNPDPIPFVPVPLTRSSTPGCETRAQLNAPEVDGENEEPRGRRKPTRPTNQPSAVSWRQGDKQTLKETSDQN